MSTAHRPNFDPAKGRASKEHLSQQRTKLDIPSHTKLKFRQPPSTSGSTASGSSEAAGRRDLKRELEEAEWEAKNRKRVKAGLDPLPMPAPSASEKGEGEDDESARRKEAIQQALELDKDSDSDSADSSEDEEEGEGEEEEDGKESQSSASSSSSSDEDEDEDEQALLLRELEKIRAERAAAKARTSTTEQLSREEEIARGNPLLNIQNHFSTPTPSSSAGGERDFGVRKRWDDDVIFKNQASAAGNTGKATAGGTGFVNDLTRSDFHRKFMNRYIK